MTVQAAPTPGFLRLLIQEAWRRARRRRLAVALLFLAGAVVAISLYLLLPGGRSGGLVAARGSGGGALPHLGVVARVPILGAVADGIAPSPPRLFYWYRIAPDRVTLKVFFPRTLRSERIRGSAVGDFPSGSAYAFGSLWVGNTAGDGSRGSPPARLANTITRVNPRTGRQEARIHVPGPWGIAAGAHALWVVGETPWLTLHRIDPRTDRVTGSLRLPGAADAIPRLAATRDDALVAMVNDSSGRSTVLVIGGRTLAVKRRIPINRWIDGMVVAGSRVWAFGQPWTAYPRSWVEQFRLPGFAPIPGTAHLPVSDPLPLSPGRALAGGPDGTVVELLRGRGVMRAVRIAHVGQPADATADAIYRFGGRFAVWDSSDGRLVILRARPAGAPR